MDERLTIWQCRDWCCESRPYAERYWNIATSPGHYESVPSFPLSEGGAA